MYWYFLYCTFAGHNLRPTKYAGLLFIALLQDLIIELHNILVFIYCTFVGRNLRITQYTGLLFIALL